MELKSCKLLALFLLFLLFLVPCFSRGLHRMDPEVYVIDYRGPETHSYIPPPNRSGGRPHIIHHRNVVLHRKSKGLRAAKGGAGKVKNHG